MTHGGADVIACHPGGVEPHDALRDRPPIALARGGAARRVEANTTEAFTLALRLGAGGIETTAHATVDGTVVLHHRASIGSRLRRRPIAETAAGDLPAEVVTLDGLLTLLSPTDHLLLHVEGDRTFEAVRRTLADHGVPDPEQIWLAGATVEQLIAWRPQTRCRLILCIAPRKLRRGLESLAAELRSADIDGLGLFHQEWTSGQVAMLNRFGRCTFGWGAEHERELASLFRCGLDAVSSEYADRLAAVAGNFGEQRPG